MWPVFIWSTRSLASHSHRLLEAGLSGEDTCDCHALQHSGISQSQVSAILAGRNCAELRTHQCTETQGRKIYQPCYQGIWSLSKYKGLSNRATSMNYYMLFLRSTISKVPCVLYQSLSSQRFQCMHINCYYSHFEWIIVGITVFKTLVDQNDINMLLPRLLIVVVQGQRQCAIYTWGSWISPPLLSPPLLRSPIKFFVTLINCLLLELAGGCICTHSPIVQSFNL